VSLLIELQGGILRRGRSSSQDPDQNSESQAQSHSVMISQSPDYILQQSKKAGAEFRQREKAELELQQAEWYWGDISK